MKNKVFKVIILLILVCTFSGCSKKTQLGIDESGKGTISYRLGIKKSVFEEQECLIANNIEEFAYTFKSKFDESSKLDIMIDKTSSLDEDILIFYYNYENIKEYNDFIENLVNLSSSLSTGYNLYEIFGCSEGFVDDKIILTEVLVKYLNDNHINIDLNNRNTRKFIKIMASSVEGVSLNDSQWLKILSDEVTKGETEEYAKIETDENGSYLNVNYMALNAIDIYVKKIADKYEDDFYNKDYADEKNKNTIYNANKCVIEETFDKIDLAGKIKESLNTRYGQEAGYTLNDFTPVMAVKFFDEELINNFTQTYEVSKEEYKNNDCGEPDDVMKYKDVDDLYADVLKLYVISFGNNTIEFNHDNLFDLYNEDNYIAISSEKNCAVVDEGLDSKYVTEDSQISVNENKDEKMQFLSDDIHDDVECNNENDENLMKNVTTVLKNKVQYAKKEVGQIYNDGSFAYICSLIIVLLLGFKVIYSVVKRHKS